MKAKHAEGFEPLVKALKEGKTIQGWSDISDRWESLSEPAFDAWPPEKFRIKPEPPKPREWTVSITNCYHDNSTGECGFRAKFSGVKIEDCPGLGMITLREVLPEP